MNTIFAQYSVISILLTFTVPIFAQAREPKTPSPTYHSAGEIPIKGQGGWDALSVDPATQRLFVSHADRVMVIDTARKQIFKEILDTPGVHCIALAPDLKKAFSTNGKEGKVSVIDLEALVTITKVSVGEKPDAIVYDPGSHEVYAFNGNSNSVSIIDGKANRVIVTLALPGKPEFAINDPTSSQIFLNLEDKNSVAVIDTKTHRVVNTWKLKWCESPTGIALDAKNHRLFSACENARLVMVDAQNGKTIASIPTGEGTDGTDFDPETNLVFSSNGKTGTVTIIKEETPNKLTVIQTLKTLVGARTIVLNPKDHRIYLPTAEFQPAQNGGRPKPIDGSQKVLIFEP